MGNNHKGIAPSKGVAKQYRNNSNAQMQYKITKSPETSEMMKKFQKMEESMKKIQQNWGSMWKYGIVPFEISQDIQTNCPALETLILDAIHTCNKSLKNVFWIQLQKWRRMSGYNLNTINCPSIEFVTVKGRGPASSVGCLGIEKQQIFVCQYWPKSTAKIKIGNILHEMTHAMGFHHEHARTDRDNYLDIDAEYKNNHNNCKEGVALGEYDFESIMHYGHGACGVRVNKKHSEMANVIGQRQGFSELDRTGIDEIYRDERKKALRVRKYEFCGDQFGNVGTCPGLVCIRNKCRNIIVSSSTQSTLEIININTEFETILKCMDTESILKEMLHKPKSYSHTISDTSNCTLCQVQYIHKLQNIYVCN